MVVHKTCLVFLSVWCKVHSSESYLCHGKTDSVLYKYMHEHYTTCIRLHLQGCLCHSSCSAWDWELHSDGCKLQANAPCSAYALAQTYPTRLCICLVVLYTYFSEPHCILELQCVIWQGNGTLSTSGLWLPDFVCSMYQATFPLYSQSGIWSKLTSCPTKPLL